MAVAEAAAVMPAALVVVVHHSCGPVANIQKNIIFSLTLFGPSRSYKFHFLKL